MPLPYAEGGYGYPEQGQSLINVTNGKLLRLLVDDEPFDVRYGTLKHHERVLDLRDGVLRRDCRMGLARESGGPHPDDAACLVRPARDRRHPLRGRGARGAGANRPAVELWSRTSRCRSRPTIRARPPLYARRWSASTTRTTNSRSRSGTKRASADCGWPPAMTHVIESAGAPSIDADSEPDLARVNVSTELAPGEQLTVVKLLAYGWSSEPLDAGAPRPG